MCRRSGSRPSCLPSLPQDGLELSWRKRWVGFSLVTMFSDMLERDRKRSGLRIAQVAWRLGITPAAYRRFEEEEAWPSFDTYDRIGSGSV